MTGLRAARQGELLPPSVVTIDADPMKVMALLLEDSNVIHFDTERLAELGLGDRPVNQGPSNLGYVVTMLERWTGSTGRLRSITARFHANAFAGDTVIAHGVVAATHASGERTLVTCSVALDRDDGTRILSGTAVVETPESKGPDGEVANPDDSR